MYRESSLRLSRGVSSELDSCRETSGSVLSSFLLMTKVLVAEEILLDGQLDGQVSHHLNTYAISP